MNVAARRAGRGLGPEARRGAISRMVTAEGSVRIEQLAARFGVSVMTVHRDLDELESRGLLRKSRGVATALASSLVESSDAYRAGQEVETKRALAGAALQFIEPGQSVFLDDSTTVLQLAPLLSQRTPLTVITNSVTLINELRGVRGISLVAVGGTYRSWCSAFMGRMTNEAIARLRADTLVISTAAVTDGVCFFQSPETVDTKQAMFEAAATRILLVDHTKFAKRALHAMAPLRGFDVVLVDAGTDTATLRLLRTQHVPVEVVPSPGAAAARG